MSQPTLNRPDNETPKAEADEPVPSKTNIKVYDRPETFLGLPFTTVAMMVSLVVLVLVVIAIAMFLL
ncbi:MAG: hypothetical protein KDI79_25470 [Anaerolineae bacterium]|nr:hypothetical protein [Anaerolineae bacterium]